MVMGKSDNKRLGNFHVPITTRNKIAKMIEPVKNSPAGCNSNVIKRTKQANKAIVR